MAKQIVAGWSLTKRCNLQCIHCYNNSGIIVKDELSAKEAFDIAKKLVKQKIAAVNFGGGECALRKDFIPICRYLQKNGIKISYTTNGTTYKLIEKNLDLFHDIGVSIDFADEKRHDWFRGRKGTYKKAIQTIKELVKNGVDTEIVTCLTKLNCNQKELMKLYHLAKSLKVNYWRLNRFRSNGRGILNDSMLRLSKNDLKSSYKILSKLIDKPISVPDPLFRSGFGGKYSIEGDPSGQTALRIQHNGEVSPSVFLSKSGGNIKNKSIKEIFNSKVFKEIRNRIPSGKCIGCKNYFHCKGGDAGASFLKYGHFNGPDPLCFVDPRKNAIVEKYTPKKWNVHELYLCTLYVPIKGEMKNDP